MIATDNIQNFLSEPRWILIAIFGALNGILIIFVYRKFSDSLENIQHLLVNKDNFQNKKQKLLGYLTNKVYWIFVAFFLILNFVESPINMGWWSFYNQPQLITVYELIETLPCCILGGIFMYMIPIGLSLAYKDLCFNTSFNKEVLKSEWMKPFRDFRWLITVTMFGAVLYAIFPPNIWGTTSGLATESHWFIFIPFSGIALVLISAILLPHYFFHRLFSNTKNTIIEDYTSRISRTLPEKTNNAIKKILLLLEKGEVERLKTWLLDVKTFGEILIVVLIHVGLVEAISILIHD